MIVLDLYLDEVKNQLKLELKVNPKDKKRTKYTLSIPETARSRPQLPFCIDAAKSPVPVDDLNTTKVYTLLNHGNEPVAIYKPYSTQNYEEQVRYSSRREVLNEVLAYEIDKSLFNKVPRTFFLENFSNGKKRFSGSVQEFVSGSESGADYGSGVFSKSDLQKIGVLDVMMLNLDRHGGNLLVKGGGRVKEVIPIDHALSFPSLEEVQRGEITFDWLNFPQINEPFEPQVLKKIEGLKIKLDENIQMCEKYELERENINLFICSNIFLYTYALKYEKNLYEIASLVQRSGRRNEPSLFEELLSKIDLNGDFNQVKSEFEQLL
eukprot:snap_masked-scaffold_128-processed-gene-0.3-mRNA-1 protein AED:1.00 eAED:1.00 QI:0/-1/0/0/-1/1/1/0/321